MRHRVGRISITGERDFYRAGGFRRLYLSPLHPAGGFLRQTRACRNRGRARAYNCSGNDKADSVATSRKCRETRRQRVEREGKASFYGALNSDEVARPIYRRGGEDDPNYPGTDKQTADEVGWRKHREG